MNVFVTGTGRCGTSTFFQATKHATNYTSHHENFNFSANTINIGSNLFTEIPNLLVKYPNAKWVHLIRNREDCIESMIKNCKASIRSYAILTQRPYLKLPNTASVYYDERNRLIAHLLPNSMKIYLETVTDSWKQCWNYMECEGPFDDSLAEWSKRYNSTRNRGRDNYTLYG